MAQKYPQSFAILLLIAYMIRSMMTRAKNPKPLSQDTKSIMHSISILHVFEDHFQNVKNALHLSVERVRTDMLQTMADVPISFEANYVRFCARDFVYGVRTNDQELQEKSIQYLHKRIAEKGNESAILLEYSAALLEYGQCTVERLQRERDELTAKVVRLTPMAQHSKRFQNGRQFTKVAGQKKAFIKYVQEQNIRLNKMPELKDYPDIYKHITGLEQVKPNTLKEWYKEAMPDVKLQQGRPTTKKIK